MTSRDLMKLIVRLLNNSNGGNGDEIACTSVRKFKCPYTWFCNSNMKYKYFIFHKYPLPPILYHLWLMEVKNIYEEYFIIRDGEALP